MDSYYLYLLIAGTTIASPGPGVVMTLTNSLKYGLKESLHGIFGVTLGMLILSFIVGGGLGVIILKFEYIFIFLKILGAFYLFYLGIKLITNRNSEINIVNNNFYLSKKESFFQGLGITLINPKPILFFMALFPQFINKETIFINQFLLLTLTFCFLIVIIHILYGSFANIIKKRALDFNYFKYVNIIGGMAYIIFSISLILYKN